MAASWELPHDFCDAMAWQASNLFFSALCIQLSLCEESCLSKGFVLLLLHMAILPCHLTVRLTISWYHN